MRWNEAFAMPKKIVSKDVVEDTRPATACGATAIKQNTLHRPSSFPLWAPERLCGGGGGASVFSPRDVTPNLPSPGRSSTRSDEPPSEHTDSREAFVAVLLRGGQGGEEREDGEFRWG